MRVLLDAHVLIWWLDDPERLSRAQQEVIAAAGAESPLPAADISLRHFTPASSDVAQSGAHSPDDSPAGVAGQGNGASAGAAARHLSGDRSRTGVVARFFSSRSGGPHSRGHRPYTWRGASDAGSQNRRRGAGRYAELIGSPTPNVFSAMHIAAQTSSLPRGCAEPGRFYLASGKFLIPAPRPGPCGRT